MTDLGVSARYNSSSSSSIINLINMVTEGNSTSSKKRKYADSSNSSRSRPGPSAAGASFAVSEDSARNGLKPLVVSTPSIALTDDVEFTLYESSAVPANGKESGKRDKGKGRAVHSMLHGDSAKLEWTSSNRMASESVPWRTSEEHVLNGQDIADNTAEEASASYALALYDPSSSTISLIDAPLHILSHIPKRLKNLPPISSRDPATNNAQARTDLGMTFGTKKSQKAIKAAERNRVDAGAQDLQVLQDVMQQGLEEGLTTLPASSQIAGRPKPGGSPNEESSTGAVVEAARLSGRPVPNIAADSPEDVYNVIGNIILTKEVQAIDAHSLIRLSIAEKERGCAMLPFKRSTWVNDRVKEVIANLGGKFKDKERLHKLKILIWISALMNMRTYSKGGLNPLDAAVLEKQFGRLIGLEAVQSLIERFAEDQRGSKK